MYARVTPGDCAGLVAIDCQATGDGATDVHVSYSLTALTEQARPSLAAFSDRYSHFLEHWEAQIRKALGDEGARTAVH